MPTVCKAIPLPLFKLFFCEPVFLPDDGWDRQPKHAVEMDKNQYASLNSYVVRRDK
jgi:hypothetical protein